MSETASSAAVRVVEVGGATRILGLNLSGIGLRGSGGEGGGGRAAEKKERRQPVKSDNPTHITM